MNYYIRYNFKTNTYPVLVGYKAATFESYSWKVINPSDMTRHVNGYYYADITFCITNKDNSEFNNLSCLDNTKGLKVYTYAVTLAKGEDPFTEEEKKNFSDSIKNYKIKKNLLCSQKVLKAEKFQNFLYTLQCYALKIESLSYIVVSTNRTEDEFTLTPDLSRGIKSKNYYKDGTFIESSAIFTKNITFKRVKNNIFISDKISKDNISNTNLYGNLSFEGFPSDINVLYCLEDFSKYPDFDNFNPKTYLQNEGYNGQEILIKRELLCNITVPTSNTTFNRLFSFSNTAACYKYKDELYESICKQTDKYVVSIDSNSIFDTHTISYPCGYKLITKEVKNGDIINMTTLDDEFLLYDSEVTLTKLS